MINEPQVSSALIEFKVQVCLGTCRIFDDIIHVITPETCSAARIHSSIYVNDFLTLSTTMKCHKRLQEDILTE